MKFIADLHIHSKYSRATSPKMDLENLDRWARIKGINVLATGDFTHPDWFKNLKEKLEPAEPGLYKLKKSDSGTRFILSVEISNIYSKAGKVRKIHNLIFSPSLEIAAKINTKLSRIGDLKSDGRPILKLDSKELLKIILNISEDCFLTCCHAWTPWFGIFGSKFGFDSIEECFENYSEHVFSVETGLSSDPPMNWRLSALDNITLISNSDAHSPNKIGREANVFNTNLSYLGIKDAIKSKDPKKFLYTIEFYPQEGKYYYDGHRKCGISLSPTKVREYSDICPVCGKPLTAGVLSRIEKLADRPESSSPKGVIPFKSLIPLKELISECLGIGVGAKGVEKEYLKLIKNLENEFHILLNASFGDIENVVSSNIAEAIIRARNGKVFIEPGYDGVFGKIGIFSKTEKEDLLKQKTLF